MYPGVEIRLLRYAVVVAEELHFGRAALRLHVAQPSLSKQIRELEDYLGVTLFDRTNRRVELTQAGHNFVREAAKSLAHSERAVQLARTSIGVDNACISIAYSPRINLQILSLIHGLVSSLRPSVNVTLVSAHTYDQIPGLLNGSIQAGLLTLPVRNDTLVVKPLVSEALVVVMPEPHPLTRKPDIKARELNGQPVISLARQLSPGFHDRLHTLFRRVGYKPNVVQDVTTEAEALYMVREGMGIAFMKISAIPRECQGIAYRRFHESSLIEETGIAYRRDNRSSNITGFIGILQERLRDLTGNVLSECTQIVQQHSDSAVVRVSPGRSQPDR